ncbi:energy-coupling factor transporter transmembrane component T family protein [Hathewaya limosa]|uniref:Energy-coupling factor transport system permease protein n=1 Tax=Hathewaya limosa TaxID=1536 RepID=A0ABU0JV74_HATLI|nr:energy-coupling factor transporter transmembrane component T [Hathewaya limosa]MDQ0480959.1 energy-coupling factor transport system permease protein [Hathewaya limosa]
MSTMLGYINEKSPVHKLTGATKLIFFIVWSLASMITYDTRILVGMMFFSLVIFKISKIKFKDIAFVVYFILFFLILNNITIFIFSPHGGNEIYKTTHVLFNIAGPYSVTLEQLFYQFNVTVKYFSVIPIALLFIATTEPSEFASSLNRIGLNYKIAYSVSIALRYIPDIQRDYHDITFAQQARGIEMSKKEKLSRRIKNSAAILMPLIFSSLDRIDTISAAMELRAFGNDKKRTWYNSKNFTSKDYIAISLVCILLALSIFSTIYMKSRFYNPFI